MTPRRVLVSACLLGMNCRYDGRGKELPGLKKLCERVDFVPFCPEQMGGLSTPRPPAERQGERVCTKEGKDVTAAYEKGAEMGVELARTLRCGCALLKTKSPACGVGEIYDGTFSGTLVAGEGLAAQKLREAGVVLFREDQLFELLTYLEKEGER